MSEYDFEIDAANPMGRWRRGMGACGEPETSGYTYCACRDCFNIAIGLNPVYCSECVEAGCPDYQGVPGMPQECQADGAYGG